MDTLVKDMFQKVVDLTMKMDSAWICSLQTPSCPMQTTGNLRSSPARKRLKIPYAASLQRTTSTQTALTLLLPPLTTRNPPASLLVAQHSRADSACAPMSICDGAVSSVTTGGDCGHLSAAAISEDVFSLCMVDLELRVWLSS